MHSYLSKSPRVCMGSPWNVILLVHRVQCKTCLWVFQENVRTTSTIRAVLGLQSWQFHRIKVGGTVAGIFFVNDLHFRKFSGKIVTQSSHSSQHIIKGYPSMQNLHFVPDPWCCHIPSSAKAERKCRNKGKMFFVFTVNQSMYPHY